jgi:hypothetical protein
VGKVEFDRLETARMLLEQLRGVAFDCPALNAKWDFHLISILIASRPSEIGVMT